MLRRSSPRVRILSCYDAFVFFLSRHLTSPQLRYAYRPLIFQSRSIGFLLPHQSSPRRPTILTRNVGKWNRNTSSLRFEDSPSIFTTGSNNSKDLRLNALHFYLMKIGIDADELADAAFRSVTTMDGFDSRFGKSAIKAYRTYIDPRPSKVTAIEREDVNVSANRIARQIDFLAKKHRSREAEWVRHTDEPKESETFPLILVLDNVRSAANVGSIYRSADACGCLEILTTGITPHPTGNGAEKLAKSALGAERAVSTRHFDTTEKALIFLRNHRPNIMLVGMETTEHSKCFTDIFYPGSKSITKEIENRSSTGNFLDPGVALFLGNEVSGLDTDIMPKLDVVVEIPMFGKKNSLNVAACAPVVMYEILRQWGAFD